MLSSTSVRWWTVLGAAAVFGAFLCEFLVLGEGAPGRGLVACALAVSGVVLLVLLEMFVLSRLALRRALHPDRLIAAVARGSGQALPTGSLLLDAVRLTLLRERLLGAPALTQALPQTTAGDPGSSAPWLSPLMKRRLNQVVLARTDTDLLVCRPDIDRAIGVIATIPLDEIEFIETGCVKLLGRHNGLIGIGFADGSAIATAYAPEFGKPVGRFFSPILDR